MSEEEMQKVFESKLKVIRSNGMHEMANLLWEFRGQKMSSDDYAELCGCTKQTVTRLINNLKNKHGFDVTNHATPNCSAIYTLDGFDTNPEYVKFMESGGWAGVENRRQNKVKQDKPPMIKPCFTKIQKLAFGLPL